MKRDWWLPKGYELKNGSAIRSLLFSGNYWQIFDTSGSHSILVAHPQLAHRWIDGGLLDEALFEKIQFGTKVFQVLGSEKKFCFLPITQAKSPDTKADALAFSLALRESRKLVKDVSFHDAIYVEQYSRLLPTWTLSPEVKDEVVLGTWLTGVVISTESFRRLSKLMGWMPTSSLAEIIEAAGFHVPVSAGHLTKKKPETQKTYNGRAVAADETIETEEPEPLIDSSQHRKFKLPGRLYLEEFFNEHIIDIIFNAEKYQALGIDFPSAVILHGPPGSGKTYAVERLAEFLDWPSFSIDSNSVGSPYIHETSKKISEVFDKAIDAAPAIIVIDEMESFLSDRQSGGTSGLHHVEEVSEFLRRIPEAIKNKVLIIAMTNMIDLIDPAILRRGRFDHVVEVKMPSKIEVYEVLESLFSKIPCSKDLNLDVISTALDGKALSDAAFVVKEGARLAARSGKSVIDQYSLELALGSLQNGKTDRPKQIGF